MTISRLMTQRNFGSLPVVEEDRTLVGLVSEYDLLQAMIEGRDLRKIMAIEMMSTHPVTATEDMKLEEVANLFQDRYITRVPVVRNGKLVGVLARRDLLFGYTKASQYWSKQAAEKGGWGSWDDPFARATSEECEGAGRPFFLLAEPPR